MGATNPVMLRVLLNRYHHGKKDALVRCLPAEEAKEVLALDLQANDPAVLLKASLDRLPYIHYSWLRPAIQKMPPFLHGPLLSVLPEFQASKLRRWFPVETVKTELSPVMRNFLINSLLAHLDDKNVMPLAFLNSTPLTPLATSKKEQLMELIDFLGVYDLAAEVRHIIDKERLKRLSPCLSAKKKQFLHMCLHQPERLAPARLDLNLWDGDCPKLLSLLHKRGIARLGKALCGQHPDLVWHIGHILDVGRGTMLKHFYSPNPIPGITPVLAQQVINLMSFLYTKSTP